MTDIAELDREKQALRMASEEGKETFDLTQGPLLLTPAFEAVVRRHESLRTVFDSELQSLLNRMLEGGQPAWRRAVGSERVFLCA
jgi:hypothetical protein